jgi:hypothetical protein
LLIFDAFGIYYVGYNARVPVERVGRARGVLCCNLSAIYET